MSKIITFLFIGGLMYYIFWYEGFPECDDVSEARVADAIAHYLTKQEIDAYFEQNRPEKHQLKSEAKYQAALNDLWKQVRLKRDSLIKANGLEIIKRWDYGHDDMGMPPSQVYICNCRAKYRYAGREDFFDYDLVNKDNEVSFRKVTGRR